MYHNLVSKKWVLICLLTNQRGYGPIYRREYMNAIDIQITQVDRLGLLLAQIADLTQEADAIKDEIKEAATAGGPSSYEGNLYRATVVASNRQVVDYKALIADLGVSAEQLQAFTKTTAVFAVKTVSR
jgi:hypothetical protein